MFNEKESKETKVIPHEGCETRCAYHKGHSSQILQLTSWYLGQIVTRHWSYQVPHPSEHGQKAWFEVKKI